MQNSKILIATLTAMGLISSAWGISILKTDIYFTVNTDSSHQIQGCLTLHKSNDKDAWVCGEPGQTKILEVPWSTTDEMTGSSKMLFFSSRTNSVSGAAFIPHGNQAQACHTLGNRDKDRVYITLPQGGGKKEISATFTYIGGTIGVEKCKKNW